MDQGSSGKEKFLRAVVVRTASVDDFSEVRKLLTAALRSAALSEYTEEEVAALESQLGGPDLVETLRVQTLVTGWLDSVLVSVAGWQSADDAGRIAKITLVAVNPMFTKLGLGRQIVEHVQVGVLRAGYDALSVQAFSATEEFFTHLRYETSAFGTQAIDGRTQIRVAHMKRIFADMLMPIPGAPHQVIDVAATPNSLAPALAKSLGDSETRARPIQRKVVQAGLQSIGFKAHRMLSKASH